MKLCACGCEREARRKYATDNCRHVAYNAKRDRKEYDRERQKVKSRRGKGGCVTGRHHLKQGLWPIPAAFIDGEAFADTAADMQSTYCLLQLRDEDGTTHELCKPHRALTTVECLSLLFDTQHKQIYGFALGYDISNWLVDLSVEEIKTLRHFGTVRFRHFRLTWIPGKMLKVINFARPQGCGDRQRTVYDLFPFCQKSFIKSLADWAIEVPDIVTKGKAARGTFTYADLPFVQDYNNAELALMGQLYRKLGEALDSANLRTNHWTGPGAVARMAHKTHQVGTFRRVENEELVQPKKVNNCIEQAYYGGRFECSYIGEAPQVYEYDLISAYPHAITEGMPCWKHGKWVASKTRPTHGYWIAHVTWKPKKEYRKEHPMWGPFPSRTAKRSLCYPTTGLGFYHGVEIEAAEKWMGHLYDFRVKWYVEWVQTCDCKPWGWVRELADERARIKHTEPGKAQAIKLCLNSLYGILADSAGIGEKPDPDGYVGFVPGSEVPRVSKTRDRYSAGLITARTRARLLEAIGKGGEDVLYVATDGIHSRVPLDLHLGDTLGDWEEPKVTPDRAIFLLGGVYAYASREVTKIRGIRGAKGYTFAQLQEWLSAGKISLSTGSRFCGCFAAASLALYREEQYRARLNTWSTDTREQPLDLMPRRKQRKDGRWVAVDNAGVVFVQNLMMQEELDGQRDIEDGFEASDWGD